MFIDPSCETLIRKYVSPEADFAFDGELVDAGKVDASAYCAAQGRAWFIDDDRNPADPVAVLIYLDEDGLMTAYEFSGALPAFHPRSRGMGQMLWNSVKSGLGVLASREQ